MFPISPSAVMEEVIRSFRPFVHIARFFFLFFSVSQHLFSIVPNEERSYVASRVRYPALFQNTHFFGTQSHSQFVRYGNGVTRRIEQKTCRPAYFGGKMVIELSYLINMQWIYFKVQEPQSAELE